MNQLDYRIVRAQMSKVFRYERKGRQGVARTSRCRDLRLELNGIQDQGLGSCLPVTERVVVESIRPEQKEALILIL